MYRLVGAWHEYIGEHAAWSKEDIVFYLNTFVYRHIVLYTYAVANLDVGSDVDILTKGAVLADNCTFLNVTEMPNFGAVAELNTLVDIGTFVYVRFFYHPKGC